MLINQRCQGSKDGFVRASFEFNSFSGRFDKEMAHKFSSITSFNPGWWLRDFSKIKQISIIDVKKSYRANPNAPGKLVESRTTNVPGGLSLSIITAKGLVITSNDLLVLKIYHYRG